MESRHARKASNNGGFSLLELLVVVGIIGALAAIGIPAYNGYISSTEFQTAENNLRMIHAAQLEHRSDNGDFCDTTDCASISLLNTNLFDGNQSLDTDSAYAFAITAADGGDSFTATATQSGSGDVCVSTIDETATLTPNSGC